MQKYIKQLLQDLQAAHNNQPAKVDYKLLHPNHPAADPQYEGILDYIIEWENAPKWKMDDLFGISSNVFPPLDKLNEVQLQQLVEAIRQLWQAFNIYTEIPETNPPIPSERIYQILLNYWRDKTIGYVSEGILHLEFCDYEVSRCPWGETHCQCKEYQQMNEDMDNFEPNPDPDSLPF
ncbi:MAG: hypothetical protein ACPG49_11885 [Chitinophagales bacterium]